MNNLQDVEYVNVDKSTFDNRLEKLGQENERQSQYNETHIIYDNRNDMIFGLAHSDPYEEIKTGILTWKFSLNVMHPLNSDLASPVKRQGPTMTLTPKQFAVLVIAIFALAVWIATWGVPL